MNFQQIVASVQSQAVAIRKVWAAQSKLFAVMADLLTELREGPKSITQEIDSLPGRRIDYCLSGGVLFDITNDGREGNPVTLQVSQDGPFIATHYPMVTWRTTLPAGATDFGRWRPVSSWPLPDQVLDTNIIDLSYKLVDGGSQRNFQSANRGPVFSRPDALQPLPVPTLFAPNSTVQLVPFYENILFEGGVATTQGWLQVDIPGYRVING